MTRHRIESRSGSTIIELLMVVVIISIVLSLMLPAILAGREAAKRVACLNNLKQVGLALHNYESQSHMFPPGVVNDSGPIHNREDPEQLHLGWVVQILPFLEQRGLSQSYDDNLSVYDGANGRVTKTNITSLLCPSDEDASRNVAKRFGVSSYAGCHNEIESPIDRGNHGVFILNKSIGIPDIADGTSSTIFVGEKCVERGDLGWASGTRATLRSTGTSINMTAVADENGVLPGGVSDLYVGGFSSKHHGGANFLFGDGSVRFLKDRINQHVYQLLGHRSDGEMIDP